VNIAEFPQNFRDLLQNVYFSKTQGPVFSIEAARLSMSNKEAVKNVMNLVYEVVPHILVDAEKNTQVKHIGLRNGESKLLEIYKNDHVQKEQVPLT
jgi:hypothetical protein